MPRYKFLLQKHDDGRTSLYSYEDHLAKQYNFTPISIKEAEKWRQEHATKEKVESKVESESPDSPE